MWLEKRRPEIMKLFQTEVYGKSPARLKEMTFQVTSEKQNVLNGLGIRKEVTGYFTGKEKDGKMHILIYLPSEAKKPVPLFVGLNFYGNHSIENDLILGSPRIVFHLGYTAIFILKSELKQLGYKLAN